MTAISTIPLWSVQDRMRKTKMNTISKPLVIPMPVKNYYSRVADTIQGLHQRGFTSDFVLLGDRLFCTQTQRFFMGNEFDILEVYSFENNRSDREQTALYAVECITNGIKGILFQNADRHGQKDIILKKLRKFWR